MNLETERKGKRKSLGVILKKYRRLLRLYLKRIRLTEQEIGGELHAC